MKLLRWIVLPPIILLAMALAVANRTSVTFSLDPFDTVSPALAFDIPLFLIALGFTLLGILMGGLGAWAQARRKAARAGGVEPTGGGLPVPRD